MAKIRIIASKNGPLLLEIDGKIKTAFCRCGMSSKKPYCDGTHAKVGFKADETIAFEYSE